MLRTVIPVRSASCLIVISPSAALRHHRPLNVTRRGPSARSAAGAGRSSSRRHRSRGRRSPRRCARRGERGELLARALLAHPRRQDRVDDDDVGGGGAPGEAVGERQRPGLGRGLGGGVGGVRVGGRLRLLGRDEDEAAAPARRRARRGRRGSCAGRCGSAGRGGDPSRRAAPRAAACPPRQPPTRCMSPSTRPKRSTSAAHQPRVASSSSRSTTRPSQRSRPAGPMPRAPRPSVPHDRPPRRCRDDRPSRRRPAIATHALSRSPALSDHRPRAPTADARRSR